MTFNMCLDMFFFFLFHRAALMKLRKTECILINVITSGIFECQIIAIELYRIYVFAVFVDGETKCTDILCIMYVTVHYGLVYLENVN